MKKFRDKTECPICHLSKNVVKNGFSRYKQRWRCKNCKQDFIKQEDKIIRIPKFQYIDIKILSIILYLAGFKITEIFEYIIKPISNSNIGLNQPKIIYQWIKKIKPLILQDCFQEKVDIKLFNVNNNNSKEIDNYLSNNICNPEQNTFLFQTNTNEILVYIKQSNVINIQKPLLFKLLLFLLSNETNQNYLCRQFNLSIQDVNNYISDVTSIFNYENTVKYEYKKHFSFQRNSVDFANILPDVKKSKKDLKINIVISFDINYKNWHILILNQT